MFSHGKHLQATSPSQNGSNRLGCNRSIISCQRSADKEAGKGIYFGSETQKETSPEVQNRGFSGPIKGMISYNYIIFSKKSTGHLLPPFFSWHIFTGSATGILCNYVNRKWGMKQPFNIDQLMNRLFDLSRYLIEVVWFSAWWIDYLGAQCVYNVHHLSCYSMVNTN